MCGTCGCGDTGVRLTELGHGHGHGHGRTVEIEEDILGANDALAAANRRALAERGVLALNLMSSPGSGKTTLLVRTLVDVGAELAMTVVEGDQETLLDAERIGATGARVVQVNTGAGCHLDATMLERALTALAPATGSVVVVENVGNLVCPALFDLGEAARGGRHVGHRGRRQAAQVPAHVPHRRPRAAQQDRPAAVRGLRRGDVRRGARGGCGRALEVIEVSATRGDGMAAWYAWLRAARSAPAGGGVHLGARRAAGR